MATGSYMTSIYSRSQSEVLGDLHNSSITLALNLNYNYAIFDIQRFTKKTDSGFKPIKTTDSSVNCPNPDALKATEQPQVTRCGRPVKKPDKVTDWIFENDLILLNDKSPTYLHSSGISTSIDLSLETIDLNYDLSWSTNTDNIGSDHFPIIINYKRTNSSATNNFKQKTNWNTFINIIQQNLNLNENINIDIITEIKKAQILSQEPEKKQISSRAPWWTAACGHLRAKEKRKLLNKARKNFKEEDWIKYKEVSAKLKRKIKACKENFWHKTCEKISSPKVLFKIIRIIKNRTNPNYSSFNIIESNGTILTNEQPQANCFLQYYAKQNNDSIPNISIPDNSQDINKPFSLKELEIAISHQKNSSPGQDKISLQSINYLPSKQ
ncbi:hypothetical protein TNCV_2295201 [Trichonephila clavipes]|nr:hypothetical protein TNCV_2295201 [Trichonephila clavipes]